VLHKAWQARLAIFLWLLQSQEPLTQMPRTGELREFLKNYSPNSLIRGIRVKIFERASLQNQFAKLS
jgi:hypothetical protein